MKTITVLIFLTFFQIAKAQEEKNQFNFAQSYLGFNILQLGVLGKSTAKSVDSQFGTRITIGGLHFWGKADFHISFPLFNQSIIDKSGLFYSEGVKTGGRWMPFGLSSKHPTPIIGAEWSTPNLWSKKGPRISGHSLNFETGLIYVVRKKYTLEFGLNYNTARQWQYYNSRLTYKLIQLPQLGFSLGIKKYIDFTAGLARETSQQFIKETEAQMRESKDLSGWSLAIGLSSNIPLSSIKYLEQFTWLQNQSQISIHPEFGLSYYLHKHDWAFRLAFRPINKQSNAYGLSAQLKEKRWSVESFKFLFDYKGFVPFIGLGLDLNNYQYSVTNYAKDIHSTAGNNISSSIVFGWDIRPTQVEWFILRTNMRLNHLLPNQKIANFQSVDLEFNFIQFAFYPERLSYYFNK